MTPPIKDTTNNNVVRLPVQHAQPELQPETEAEPNTTSGDADDLDDDEIDDDLDKEANAYKEDYRRKTLPWREPVDGLALLDDLTTTFQRFMVLPPGAPEVLALWAVASAAVHLCRLEPWVSAGEMTKNSGAQVT